MERQLPAGRPPRLVSSLGLGQRCSEVTLDQERGLLAWRHPRRGGGERGEERSGAGREGRGAPAGLQPGWRGLRRAEPLRFVKGKGGRAARPRVLRGSVWGSESALERSGSSAGPSRALCALPAR